MAGLYDDDFEVIDQSDASDGEVDESLPPKPETVRQILDWLQPTAYDDGTSEYLRHLMSHVQGTGDWLPATEEYQEWHSSSEIHTLWVKAVPGAGKSVLAAHQRSRLSTTEKAPVLHFFFRQIVTSNRTPTQLVRDWLAQILPRSIKLQRRIQKNILKKHKALSMVSFQDLWDMFRNAANELPRVYCFADALDEMSVGHEDFLVKLTELGNSGSCKVFLTSRPVPRIVEVLRKQPVKQITLGPENMDGDISIYIDHRLERDIDRYIQHRLRTSGIDLGNDDARAAIEPLVRSTLQSKAQGSFLYARLMMDNVLQAISKVGGEVNPVWMKRILDDLPTGLSEMYGGMLRDHAARSGTSPELQRTILQWVTHAERPLRMLELAAIVDFGSGTLERNKDTKAVVRTGCGPLLEILPSDVVGPVHHSFTEYLTTKSDQSIDDERRFLSFENEPTHRVIAEQCIKYIMHVFQDTADEATSALKLSFPFLDYALQSWPAHVSKCGTLDAEMIQLLDSLFTDNRVVRRVWANRKRTVHEGSRRAAYWDRDDSSEEPSTSKETHITPLHIAASVGIASFLPHLQALGHDIDAISEKKETATHFAARDGNAEALEMLIQLGADPNTFDENGLSPLHFAATNGHTEAVEVLLKRGVDPMTPRKPLYARKVPEGASDYIEGPPIEDVAEAGHVQTMKAFLEYLSVEHISLAMHYALLCSQKDVVVAILQHPRFEINRKLHNRVPIFTAAQNRDLELMRLFLDAGASVSIPSALNDSSFYRHRAENLARFEVLTPLHAYVRASAGIYYKKGLQADECREAIKLLIDAGCPLEAKDLRGSTALRDAQTRHVLSSILIAHGASLEPVLEHGNYPLHENAGQDMEAMKLWIGHGCDVNGLDADGLTILELVVGGRAGEASEIIKALLELGADPKVPSRGGSTPLHQACWAPADCEPHPVKLLIDAGADVNARDAQGMTPLMRCMVEDMAAFGQLYVDAGADVNARDRNGDTWLSGLCQSSGHVLRDDFWTLPFDLDFKTCGAEGANLIHNYVCRGYRVDDLNKLIDRGADPHALDCAGNSSLHYAMQNCYFFSYRDRERQDPDHAAKRLIEIGVDATKLNFRGQSIFLFATATDRAAMEFLDATCEGSFDLNRADVGGITPLHVAASLPDDRTARLLEQGADLFARTHCGRSVLHTAALADKPETLAVLLSWLARDDSDRSKALVNAQDEKGASALHYAALTGRAESVKALLDAGAMPDLLDSDARTPLAWCALFPKEQETREKALQTGRSRPSLREILAQNWEGMVRGLSDINTRYDPRDHQVNIRQCVRYLCAAGAKICDPNGRHITYSTEEPLRMENVLDAVLRSGCQPLISEVVKQMKARNEEAGYRAGNPEKFALELELAKHESHESFLQSLAESELDDKRRSALMQKLIEDDFQEQILSMCRKGYDFFRQPDEEGEAPGIVQLASNGSHETLRLLRPLLSHLQPSPPLASRETSVNLSLMSADRLKGHAKDWKAGIEALKGPMAGLLLEICDSVSSNLEAVKVIVEHYGCSRDEMMIALFQMANQSNWWHLEAVKYLLSKGLDVNHRFPHGSSALLVACTRGGPVPCTIGHYKYEMVSLLLSHGADPDVVDEDGQTCLNEAAHDRRIFKTLLKHGASPQLGANPPIIEAISLSDVELVKLIIEQDVDLNKLTPIAAGSDEESTKIGPNRDNKWKRSREEVDELRTSYPLHFALCQERPWQRMDEWTGDDDPKLLAIVSLLLDGGADPFAIARNDVPIIHDALARTERAKMLLNIPKLDTERRDEQGRTLLLACCCNYERPIKLLVQKLLGLGSDATAVDHQNRNLLHHLLMEPEARITSELEEICEELLSMKNIQALASSRDDAGFTPVQLALANASWKVVRLLMDHGAEISSPDPNGESALHQILGRVPATFSNDLRTRLEELRKAADDHSDDFSDDEDTEDHLAPYEIADYLELRARVDEQSAAELLAVIDVCKSAGNDINALSASGAREPPIFGYLRKCPTRTEGRFSETDGEKSRYVPRLNLLVEEAGVDLRVLAGNGQCGLHVLANCSPARDSRQQGGYRNMKLEEPLRAAWKLLVDAGLDPYLEDNEQRSALDIAAAAGNTTIMELF